MVTRLATTVRMWMLIAVAAIVAIALVAWWAVASTPASSSVTFDISISEGSSIRTASEAADDPPPGDPNIGTITWVGGSYYCGTMIGVTEIRYGDRFGAVIPCIEFYQGLPFKVGDTQRLIVDAHDRITAIEWNGRMWHFDGYAAVKTPASVIGRVGWSDYGDHIEYSTQSGEWSWPSSGRGH